MMSLLREDIADAIAFRRRLHAMPEVSGEEGETAREVVAFLAPTGPDEIVTGLGGHGVAVVYASGAPGPTVLLRAELDALPIEERGELPYRSRVAGKAHLCGHDGHTATLAALARDFARRRPARGRVVLMFQPAEETGAGARAVVADPRFAAIRPDMSFSYHNYPGIRLGHAWIDMGVVNCASRGIALTLTGKTSHASEPEHGVSPMAAIAMLMPALANLGNAAPSSDAKRSNDFAMVTVTHARLGERAFGISPGIAEVCATLRTLTDGAMAALVAQTEGLARRIASTHGLGLDIAYTDIFAHVENAPSAVAHLRRAMTATGVTFEAGDLPFRASEDFGVFGHNAPAAMVFLGAGEHRPKLHNPDYDFPDELIAIAAPVLAHAARQLVGGDG